MKQLKKTLLTLALLLTAATGAWAQPEITTIPNGDFETWTYDGEDMPNNWNSNATSDGSLNGFYGGKQLKRSTDVRPGSSGQYSCSIWSKSVMGVTNIGILTSGRIHFGAASSTSNANYIYSDRDGSNTKNNVTNPCAMPFTGKPTAVKVWVKYVQGGTGYGQYATAKFSATIHGDADYVAYNLAEDDNDDNKALVVASAEQEIAYNNGEWEQLTIPFNYTDNNVVPAYILINAYTNAYPGKGRANDYLYIDDIELEYASASSGPEVAWNKATNSGTFTMPGGNVTLQPEYYPQAALAAAPSAINNVPATTDGAIVEAGTVANIGETTTAQGTVMYYVSQTALDDAALLALAADAWTADVPTAESLAAGQAYVYYYVRGNDSNNDDENFSDGDILSANALTVTIAAEPTYAVTFADGVNPEPPAEPEWTASPNAGVKKGQQVTVTYTGSKKVIGVKAEKKARPEFVPSATIQDLSSFVEVKNNKDGTITLRMPTLNPSTYNVTNSTISNGEHTLHFGYEMGSGTNMSSIGANIITKSWSDHTPFSELDKTIDITSGMPRVAIMITGHVKSSTCPAPGKEHYWGLYRYTNPVKVTYNLGGGSVSGSTADKVEYLFSGDALATTFAAPTREGYTFDGWYTSAEGGTKLTASNATSATTIYAHWNAIAE